MSEEYILDRANDAGVVYPILMLCQQSSPVSIQPSHAPWLTCYCMVSPRRLTDQNWWKSLDSLDDYMDSPSTSIVRQSA